VEPAPTRAPRATCHTHPAQSAGSDQPSRETALTSHPMKDPG